jgi:hypothetical protein
VFDFIQNVLPGAPLPPPVSAAFYRVIAQLPRMRLIGATRDPLGRRGVAVGWLGYGARWDFIFSPTTGVLLAERLVSLSAKLAHAPPGTTMNWTAIEDQAIVHSDHQLPRPIR